MLAAADRIAAERWGDYITGLTRDVIRAPSIEVRDSTVSHAAPTA